MHRSLGSDHSLNTPRCTCRGIIHCLYFPLLLLLPIAPFPRLSSTDFDLVSPSSSTLQPSSHSRITYEDYAPKSLLVVILVNLLRLTHSVLLLTSIEIQDISRFLHLFAWPTHQSSDTFFGLLCAISVRRRHFFGSKLIRLNSSLGYDLCMRCELYVSFNNNNGVHVLLCC